MATEKEKMLAGGPYCDAGDPELMELWYRAKNLAKAYNALDYDDKGGQRRIMEELLGSVGRNVQITAPFFVDYGKFIHIGDDCLINMNCVFLDCNRISLGDRVLIAPGVHIYAVFHPMRGEERVRREADGSIRMVDLTAPVSIGSDVWIGGGSIILPGVNIGSNVTIGAGSIVSKSIPDNSLAYGSPCRVVRRL